MMSQSTLVLANTNILQVNFRRLFALGRRSIPWWLTVLDIRPQKYLFSVLAYRVQLGTVYKMHGDIYGHFALSSSWL